MFPPLPEDEFQALKADIATNGQLVPILIDAEGRIVDGVSRYRACAELGIEPRVEKIGPRDDPVEVAIKANAMRRQITRDQRAAAAAISLKWIAEAMAARGEKGDPKERCAHDFMISIDELEAAIALSEADYRAHGEVLRGKVQMRKALKTVERAASEPRVVEVGEPRDGGEIEQPVDGLGNPLTAELAAIWKDSVVLDRLAQTVREIADFVLNSLRTRPVADWLDRDETARQLRAIERAVKGARPWAVCPFCAGEGCDRVCRRTGWVPKEIYQRWEKFGEQGAE